MVANQTMKDRSILSVLLILLGAGCVDRLDIDIGGSSYYPVVIDGHISDQPGPYVIRVSKAFDIESKLSLKTDINVKNMIITDNHGTSEKLTKIRPGVYQTHQNGIRGTIGRVYQLKVELLDGRVYESNPDTLLSPGSIDSIHYEYKEERINEGELIYGFDVFFNSSSGDRSNFHFLWQFVGTYKVDANPELYDTICIANISAELEGRCPKPLPCSGYVYNRELEVLEMIEPCECCICWVNFFNENVIISDNQLIEGGSLRAIKAGYVPINQWTFKYKVNVEIRQLSLSRQSFAFWKSVKDQKQASNSLFLPVTGKVPSNFTQIGGPTAPVEGVFFATSISSKSVFITPKDVPNQSTIPVQDFPLANSCLRLFANASTLKPSFWED
jgi:hypothetical protein